MNGSDNKIIPVMDHVFYPGHIGLYAPEEVVEAQKRAAIILARHNAWRKKYGLPTWDEAIAEAQHERK